jgi:hypothetical protein
VPLGEYPGCEAGGNEYIFVGADSGRACFGVYDSYEAMEERRYTGDVGEM